MDPRISSFRWPVTSQRSIAVPAHDVWELISTPGNLELCHPYCKKNPVLEWPGAESRDEVHYLSGWVYERRFCNWIDGVGYDLNIGRPGGGQSFVSWRVEETGDQSCALNITVCPHTLQGVPVAIRWLPHMIKLRPALQSYLESVVSGFEWYAMRGVAVPRDQFGRHPWFSATR